MKQYAADTLGALLVFATFIALLFFAHGLDQGAERAIGGSGAVNVLVTTQ